MKKLAQDLGSAVVEIFGPHGLVAPRWLHRTMWVVVLGGWLAIGIAWVLSH